MRAKYTRHGKSGAGHPVYVAWKGMRSRCSGRRPYSRKYYTDRGIAVCARWDHFPNFWRDMHKSFRRGLTLDRIDNNKGYCKANCRWASKKTQARNRRSTRIIDTPKGRMPMVVAAKLFGLKLTTLWQRIARGNCPRAKLFDQPK